MRTGTVSGDASPVGGCTSGVTTRCRSAAQWRRRRNPSMYVLRIARRTYASSASTSSGRCRPAKTDTSASWTRSSASRRSEQSRKAYAVSALRRCRTSASSACSQPLIRSPVRVSSCCPSCCHKPRRTVAGKGWGRLATSSRRAAGPAEVGAAVWLGGIQTAHRPRLRGMGSSRGEGWAARPLRVPPDTSPIPHVSRAGPVVHTSLRRS